jgi:hypothetical protein
MQLEDIFKALKPTDPKKGPPLPGGFDISWPGFFQRGIQRIFTEGPAGPYKTVKKHGIAEELKREIHVVTGWRPK